MICARICCLALATLALSSCAKKTMPPIPEPGMTQVPCSALAPWGFPQQQGADSDDVQRRKSPQVVGFICHRGQFALGYDQSLRVPRWAMEIVDPAHLQGAPARIRKDWRVDPYIPKGFEVLPSDYSKEVTKDKIGVKAFVSYKNFANDEVLVGRTFYLSNTAPAIKKDNTPGAWERLEDQVAKWAVTKGDLLVISGPIFLNGTPLGWTGHTQKQRGSRDLRGVVAIPTDFYKIIVDIKSKEAIAFMVPNDDSPSSSLASMAKKVSDIEQLSGLNFFPTATDEDRHKIVQEVDVKLWPIQ